MNYYIEAQIKNMISMTKSFEQACTLAATKNDGKIDAAETRTLKKSKLQQQNFKKSLNQSSNQHPPLIVAGILFCHTKYLQLPRRSRTPERETVLQDKLLCPADQKPGSGVAEAANQAPFKTIPISHTWGSAGCSAKKRQGYFTSV